MEQERLHARIGELEEENVLLRERIEHLEKESGIDALTGAKNRRVFDSDLEETLKLVRGEIEEHRAGVEPLKAVSLIFADLDHFKQINDTYGHPAGDEVLRTVSSLMTESVRGHERDVVARVGGEELVILMAGANEEIAMRKAKKIRAAVEELSFEKYPELRVTASFGVASSASASGRDALYANADQALYRAKEEGRNRVVAYSSL